MKMKDILTLLDARLLRGLPEDESEFCSAFSSDMMSDVLAYGQGQGLLLTGLLNQQVIRTAEMLDMRCIVFVRARPPARRCWTWPRKRALPLPVPPTGCLPPAACCTKPA